MRSLSILLGALASTTTHAAYSGDIVQYWVDQSAILANGTIIGGLASPPSGWFEAIVQAAVYKAALKAKDEPLAFQQLAVSHAAHDSLVWVFHGTRLYATIDQKLKAILEPIGIESGSAEDEQATKIGRDAAIEVAIARTDDKIANFVDYEQQPALPGVYQARPNGPIVPDTPQARYLRLFGGLGDVKQYRAPPPPSVNSTEYEKYVLQVKEVGGKISTNRTAYQTETAWYWKESSPIGWNRLAHAVVGNTLAEDVVASAKFYAQLNYALSNAAIASWDSKSYYNSWRPITAIRRPGVWLATGRNVSDPTWTPELDPTPNHQDYLSTHATFGGAAAAVIARWNGGDAVDVSLSSNVSAGGFTVITRRITSLRQAVKDNGDSRVFGGIHFQFASDVGGRIGEWVGNVTWDRFDEHWDEF